MARNPTDSNDKSAGAGSGPSTDDLAKQIEDLKADLARISETLADFAKARGKAATDAAYAEAEKLYRRGRKKVHDIHAQAEEMQDHAERMVREQPAAAMGIAAGIGFLIGLLMARK